MTWVKLDDQFFAHPKVRAAGPRATLLYLAGLTYAARYMTDGAIPKSALAIIAAESFSKPADARALVEAGMWHDEGDEYRAHDYLEHNPSRAEVESKRDSKRMAGAMGAAKRWASDSHSTSHDRRNAPDPSPKEMKEPRKRKPVDNFLPTEAHGEYADKNGLRLEDERLAWLDWCEANGRTYSNLNAGFSTWLRQAVNFGRGKNALAPPLKVVPAEAFVCRKCSNTGRYMERGTLVECDHRETA